MFRDRSANINRRIPLPGASLLVRVSLIAIIIIVGLVLPVTAAQQDSRQFLKSLVGDWIGTCEQSTDGKVAENKYFHANIRQVDSNTFSGKFDYYRNTSDGPLNIGQSTVKFEIGSDGVAKGNITGKGIVLVDKKPKNQEHNLTETLTYAANGLQGTGGGKLSVSGMPFGVGKNGKVQKATSSWTISNGVLNIDQMIKVGFRALVFNKSFKIAAHFTAKKGTNVASLMPKSYAKH